VLAADALWLAPCVQGRVSWTRQVLQVPCWWGWLQLGEGTFRPVSCWPWGLWSVLLSGLMAS
jgi:hypothetical protein